MRVTLEIVSGPHSGRKLVIRSGYVVQVGRTEWADFALPHDSQLSAVHFAIECGQNECRIRDLQSSNGTRVNRQVASEAVLRDRDEIDAGQTCFVVHVEDAVMAPSPAPAAVAAAAPQSERPAQSQQRPSPREPRPGLQSLDATARLPEPSPRPAARALNREPGGGGGVRLVLEAVEGPSRLKRVSLLPGQVIQVGRTERADLVFPLDPHMSSLHFALANENGVCRLRDLNSTNGTLVNGDRVSEAVLADRDKIQAGQTTFAIRMEGGRPAPSAGPATPAACFRTAINDPDPAVRREVLLAAVWTRQPWVLDHCRRVSARPSLEHWDAIYLLAVLGTPEDLPRMLAIGRAAELGPKRFQALGAYGHPAVVEVLLAAMAGDDAQAAVGAGAAFRKIAGVDVDSDRLVRLPPETIGPADESGDSEAPPPEQVILPDGQRARAYWGRLKNELPGCTRCCCGYDVSAAVSQEILGELDMESRWEAALRGNLQGTWQGSLIELEQFPQRPPFP